MSAPRIYTGDEARVLREAATPGPWHHQSLGLFRGNISAGDVHVASVAGVLSEDAVLLAAAPDLVASVEHHAARADSAEARIETAEAREERATLERDAAQRSLANVVAERDTISADLHRVTMERDGARDLAQEAQEARIKQSLELAEARAEVVRLRARTAELSWLLRDAVSMTCTMLTESIGPSSAGAAADLVAAAREAIAEIDAAADNVARAPDGQPLRFTHGGEVHRFELNTSGRPVRVLP